MTFTSSEEEGNIEYLSSKRLPKLVDEMLEECCVVRPDNPAKHLISFLTEMEGRAATRHPKLSSVSSCTCVSETEPVEEGAGQKSIIGFMQRTCAHLDASYKKEQLKTVIVGGDPTYDEDITAAICMLIAQGYRVLTTESHILPLPAFPPSLNCKTSAYDLCGGVFVSTESVFFNGEGRIVPLDDMPPKDTKKGIKEGLVSIPHRSLSIAMYEGVLVTDSEWLVDNYVRMVDCSLDLRELRTAMESHSNVHTIHVNCQNGTTGRIAREVLINRLGLPESSLVSEVPLPENHPAYTKAGRSRATSLGRDGCFVENSSELAPILKSYSKSLNMDNLSVDNISYDHLCPCSCENAEGSSSTSSLWNVGLQTLNNPITGVPDSLFAALWLLKARLSRNMTLFELLSEYYNKNNKRLYYGVCEVPALGNELPILAGVGESASAPTATNQDFTVELSEQSASVKVRNDSNSGKLTFVWLSENTDVSQNPETVLQPAIEAFLSTMRDGGWEGNFNNIEYPSMLL
eukprot:TRINITY_DN16899_c0_g1_i1.p1 TRINITY_DN16899_c0_g1~~TRINITY_DN16899_c0_g1_i1.p1  ORF type:complete len:517 (+),score=71.16 TRINITY_DN16899_c0_g1_i1:44-1594(+)